MKFGEAIKTCFSKYADFSGRARRSEYWFWALFTGIAGYALGLIGGFIFGADSPMSSLLSGLFGLAVLIPNLAVAWRRLHDIGKSGGGIFICLIPLVGWIIYLVWVCRDSQPGENRFGPDPKSDEYF